MKNSNVIKGPILPTASAVVYSITLLSGNIVTNPSGFGNDQEFTPNNPLAEVDIVVENHNELSLELP